jgi:hypothetical protein
MQTAERTGFEPAEGFDPFTDLANRRIRPLCHLSHEIRDRKRARMVQQPCILGQLPTAARGAIMAGQISPASVG